jgi:hypothetical protein
MGSSIHDGDLLYRCPDNDGEAAMGPWQLAARWSAVPK